MLAVRRDPRCSTRWCCCWTVAASPARPLPVSPPPAAHSRPSRAWWCRTFTARRRGWRRSSRGVGGRLHQHDASRAGGGNGRGERRVYAASGCTRYLMQKVGDLVRRPDRSPPTRLVPTARPTRTTAVLSSLRPILRPVRARMRWDGPRRPSVPGTGRTLHARDAPFDRRPGRASSWTVRTWSPPSDRGTEIRIAPTPTGRSGKGYGSDAGTPNGGLQRRRSGSAFRDEKVIASGLKPVASVGCRPLS